MTSLPGYIKTVKQEYLFDKQGTIRKQLCTCTVVNTNICQAHYLSLYINCNNGQWRQLYWPQIMQASKCLAKKSLRQKMPQFAEQ